MSNVMDETPEQKVERLIKIREEQCNEIARLKSELYATDLLLKSQNIRVDAMHNLLDGLRKQYRDEKHYGVSDSIREFLYQLNLDCKD